MNTLGNNKKEVQVIKNILNAIEKANDINILIAVVVGSRQFGIEGPKSDWDIRFIYQNNLEWYFKSNDKTDSIEGKTADGMIEYLGFSMPKAVESITKSTGLFFEWFSSDLVIKAAPSFWDDLYTQMKLFYSPIRVYKFYYTIATKARKDYRDVGFNLKTMLVYVRAILSTHQLKSYGEVIQDLSLLISYDKHVTPNTGKILQRWIDYRKTGNEESAPTEKDIKTVVDEFEYFYQQLHNDPGRYVAPPYRDPKELDDLHFTIATKTIWG